MTTHAQYWTQGLHRALQQRPDATATIFGDRTRTFREQVDRVGRLAGALRAEGVRDGARVGVLALNSDRYVEAVLAIGWADGVFNALDVMRAPTEMAPMLSETQTTILFVDDTFAPAVPQLQAAHPELHTIIHMGEQRTPPGMRDHEDLISGNDPAPDARRGGDQPIGLLHTGGTTDAPKAVLHTCNSMMSLVFAFGGAVPGFVGPGTRQLQVTPMSHMSGVGSILTQSQYGNTLVAVPGFDEATIIETIEKHQITTVFIVPPMLQRVVDHPDTERRDLSSVHTIMYGGSPITDALLARSADTFPNAGFTQLYGMTESMSCTFLNTLDHRPGEQRRSAGRSAVHAEVRVVDENDDPVATGSLGEILLRGPGLMQGYWGDPDATAAALRGGWMHTGDVGRLDENGYLYVVDRLKDLIIVGGDNVHSAEVENALAAHPDVAAAAVIAVPDGEIGERVHAVVVLKPEADADDEQLQKHCTTLLADHKVPRSWEYVDALPTSPTGKVLKRTLRERHWVGRQRQIN